MEVGIILWIKRTVVWYLWDQENCSDNRGDAFKLLQEKEERNNRG